MTPSALIAALQDHSIGRRYDCLHVFADDVDAKWLWGPFVLRAGVLTVARGRFVDIPPPVLAAAAAKARTIKGAGPCAVYGVFQGLGGDDWRVCVVEFRDGDWHVFDGYAGWIKDCLCDDAPPDAGRVESAVDAAIERAAGMDERLRYPDKER